MQRILTILFLFLFSFVSFSQININNNSPFNSPHYLIDSVLLGCGISASNQSFQGDPMQLGFFDATSTSLGIDKGIVISTGDIAILDPGFTGLVFDPLNTVTDPDLLNVANSVPPLLPSPYTNSFNVTGIYDVAILEFDFIATADTLSFDYIFGSQEYFEFENSQYNDVFGFFLSGPGISGPYSSPSYHPNGSVNLAVVPNSSPELPITISSVNSVTPINAQYFIDNRSNLNLISYVYGYTTEFTAAASLVSGQTYHIRLAIADGSDNNKNSFVWLDGGSFSTTDFSPSFSVDLSDSDCEALTDLTITISQDSNEVDIDHAILTSDRGSFNISSMNIGDNIGSASINLYSNSFLADLIIHDINLSGEVVVEAIDQLTALVLDTFILNNNSGGGVTINAISPGDSDTLTSGNSSIVTFNNVFTNPNNPYINFTAYISSELCATSTLYEYEPIYNCITFSPSCICSLSDNNCEAINDLTISFSQDSNEVDIDYAYLTSNNGSFLLSSLSLGDTIGSATMNLYLNTFNADLIVNSIVSSSEIIVEAIDQLTGALLGTFTIKNLLGGGVEIFADSPPDGNNVTSGNSSSITFNNIFQNPNSTYIQFTSNITSELGDNYVNNNYINIQYCIGFTPTVSMSLSNLSCDTTDLYISLSQDSNEVDIDYAVFTSDGGSFLLSSLSLGDTIGSAAMNLYLNTFNAGLIVNSIVSSSEIIVEAIDQLTGALLGTFTIKNLVGGGVEIFADSPPDGNNITSGNSSTIIFNNVFLNPISNNINFTSNLTSELGDVYANNFPFYIYCIYIGCTDPSAFNYDPIAIFDNGSCIPNNPRLNVSYFNPSCYGFNDGAINLSGTGGTGNYNYQLSIYDSTLSIWITIGQSPIVGTYTLLPVSFNNLYTGLYKIVIEDEFNNKDSSLVTLFDPGIIDLDEIIVPASPSNNNDGSIILTNISGGSGLYSFLWTGPNSFSSNNQDIFNLESGFYTLVVTDDNLCSQTFVFFIDILISGCTDLTANNYDPLATFDNGSCCYLNFYNNNIILCLGDSIDLIYSGSVINVDNYLWSTGDTTSSLFVSPTVDSIYWLKQTTNGFHCYDTVSVTISCLSFSPAVSISLSDLNCSITDLTINVSQDSNEVDMDLAIFTSDGGFFTIPTMSIGDNIGNSSMNIGVISINADLIVSNIISSSEIIVEAINQSSGSVLGTFVIKNLIGGGVEIIASSPGDGNSYSLNGNNSTVTFINVFDSPNSGFLNFTSNITSELGNIDLQVFPMILNCVDFSPSVSVLLSNTNCESITDLTINVSQDSMEVDMDTAIFISDGGYFLISAMSIGDNIGSASMSVSLNTFTADLIVNSIVSSSQIIVEVIDQLTGGLLGTFIITNLIGGGVEIVAVSVDDGNVFTNGNTSSVTFFNTFHNPNTPTVTFTSNITSELGELYQDLSSFVLSCTISPTVIVSLSDLNCSLTDLTITVAQDSNEVDIDTAFFISDGGSFIITSMLVGDNIGSASMSLSLNTFTADLIVNSIVSSSQIIVEAIDQLTGALLGTFTITNLIGGGVEIIAVSPDDGNTFTSGHISIVNFNNVFLSPITGFLNFTSIIISETGDTDTQSFSFILNCTNFTPNVIVSLSDLTCGVLADLTISVSQDSNEVDIDTAFFTSNGGSFTISTMSVGDTIGTASMILSLNSYSTNLIISSILSSSEIIVEAVDQISGIVLGSFTITNLVGGGVEIIAISPDDGNLFTHGNSSVVSFSNVFITSSTGLLTFTSNILSELGDLDIQTSSFAIGTISSYFTIFRCNSYSWNGNVFDSSGTYVDTMSSIIGCDSVVTLTLTIDYSSESSDTVSVCHNYLWNGVLYDSTGIYIDTILNNVGCDSVMYLHLSINSNFSNNIITACNNYLFNGILYDSSGVYTDTILNSFGCDSIVTIDLTVNDSYILDLTFNKCDSLVWNGIVFLSTGIYTFSDTTINGCDSVVTLTLTIDYSSESSDTVSVCHNYLWNGVLYDSTGIYIDTILNNVGCDSVMYLHLSINSNFSNNIITACNNYLFNGILYDSSGVYTDTILNSFGCDSIVTIDLTVEYTSSSIDSITACDSYLWNGVTYDSSGVYYLGGSVNNYSMSFNGVSDNVNLDQNPLYGPTTSSDFTISIWVSPNVSHTGMIANQYENTIPANSNYFLSLNSNNSYRVSGNGTNYYDFGSANIGVWQYVSLVFNSSGSVDTYIDGLSTGSSAINLLSVVGSMPLEIGDIFTGGCTGCIGPFNGMLDNVDIWNTALSQQDIQDNMLCSPVGSENGLVGYWNFEEGVGTTAYDRTPNGNDGVINGAIYDAFAPVQSCSLANINGCDSTSILYLTINYTLSTIDTLTVCNSLLWNGIVYDSSGTYVDTLLSSSGCDSIVNLFLIVNNSNFSTVSTSACDSLLWNGVTYYNSGIYDTILINAAGCDSFTEIYLTIIPSIYNTLNIHSCGSFIFGGNVLDSSGLYYDTLPAINGCDSIITLDLLVTDNIVVIPTIFNVSCYGDSSGVIDLDIINGSPPFSLLWSNGSVLEDINNLLGDSLYSCSIIDSAGCSLDTSFFISQPSELRVTENINNVSCYNGNDGSINLNVIGGLQPYVISWGSNDTIDLYAGMYAYLVTDSNGCIVLDSVEITEESPIQIDVNSDNIQCFGQATGFIEINVNPGSGVPGYTYEWTGPNLFSSISNNIYNLFAGDYLLTITDANLCEFDTIISLTQPVNLPQNTNIQISNYSGFNIRCKGESSGWVSVVVSGGYEPYTYLWSNLSTSDSIYDLSAGTYILEVTDSLGCVIIFDFPLIETVDALTSSILATTDYNGYNISCYGLDDAALQAVVSGGVPNYDYFWNSVQLSDSITDLFSGDYELTVYDKNNCISTSNITLTQPDSLYININSFTDTCSKGVGRAEVSVFGGVNPFNYEWSNGSTNQIINNFSEGEYQVIVTDANLCQVSDSIIIFNLPSPIIDFGIYPDNQRLFDQLDDPIVFVDLTNGIWQDIVIWNWDYNDGNFGSDSISYHSYSDTGSFVVMLTTISEYNCIDTLTKLVVISDYNLYIPNAFTPFSTDDDLNNIFKAYGIGIVKFKMDIYSRWGDKIFDSDNIEYGWDGTSYEGNQVPVGIYIYLIEAENIYGEIFKYHGQVKLIR